MMSAKHNCQQYNERNNSDNGTAAEIASETLLKAICHPPKARVVAQIKNMHALAISRK